MTTKIETLINVWEQRPRRQVDWTDEHDLTYVSTLITALKEALPEITGTPTSTRAAFVESVPRPIKATPASFKANRLLHMAIVEPATTPPTPPPAPDASSPNSEHPSPTGKVPESSSHSPAETPNTAGTGEASHPTPGNAGKRAGVPSRRAGTARGVKMLPEVVKTAAAPQSAPAPAAPLEGQTGIPATGKP